MQSSQRCWVTDKAVAGFIIIIASTVRGQTGPNPVL